MKRILGLLPLPALFLGGLLANPLPAQEVASLAPEGSFMALRIASLDRLSQLIKQFAPAEMLEEGEDPVAEMLGFFHSLEGVDRTKPVLLFMAGGMEEPLPWLALPVQDPAAFQEGMQMPAKPLMKAGYALVSPALMGLEEGSAPKLGMPGLGVPEGDLGMRLLVGTVIGKMEPNQLAQLKLTLGFFMGLGFAPNPEINKTFDRVFEALSKIQALDVAMSAATEMSLTLTLTGAPGSELANLGGLVKGGPLHPAFGLNEPHIWSWSSFELADDAPKLVSDLLQSIKTLSASNEEQAKAFGTGGGMVLGTLPGGALLCAASREVLDPDKVKTAMGSKEGFLKLLADMVPMVGSYFFDPEELEEEAADIKFQAGAFNSAGTSVNSLSLQIPDDEDMSETQRAALHKLFPGGSLRMWAGMIGKHAILTIGPQDAAQRVFTAASGAPASLPGFAQGAVAAGQFKLGTLVRTFAPMGMEEAPEGVMASLKGLPDAQLRFTLIPKGPSMTAKLSVRMADLVAVVKALEALSSSDDDEDDDEEDDWDN